MRKLRILDALLPKTRQGILAATLVRPEKAWYVSELARRMGVPASSLQRELHDLTAGHPLAAGRECVLHGDPGPFNAIFQDGMPVAFIDWTSCRPGDRLDDLSYLAWTWCIQAEGSVPVDAQAAHLRELRDAYGPVQPETLIDAMTRSQDRIVRHS